MDMGKGYDDMIGCTTCSLSQRLMQKVLLPCFILVVSSCFNPCVCLIVELWTCINSVDTFMYPYALPILQFPYPFSSLCLSCNLSSSLRPLQASAYVLRHLSAMWLQLQMKGRKSEWEWVLIGVSPLNTGDRVQWVYLHQLSD